MNNKIVPQRAGTLDAVTEDQQPTGELRAPVATDVATCWNCKGLRLVKCEWPPYGSHTRHDANCNKRYGFCMRLCTVCARGIQAGQVTPELYTWIGQSAGELPYKSLESFNRAKQPRAYDEAKAWLEHAAANERHLHNIILAGVPGTGKTHLVAAIANTLTDAKIACLFATVAGFFNAYYAGSFEEKHMLMRRASEIAVLVLDDLDKVHVPTATDGAYQKKTLFELLNQRYVAQKPTLITTNAQESLSTWLDQPTISRLMEHVKLVPMNGADYRLRGKDSMR